MENIIGPEGGKTERERSYMLYEESVLSLKTKDIAGNELNIQ
jgi:16S rRNA U1498 N3-methylase RsmE